VQELHVVPVGPRGVLRLQGVVGPPERRGRVQVGPEGVAGEGARLAHQPGDDVPVVDRVLVLPAQPRQPLHQALGVPDLDLLDADPHLDHLPDQPRRHRVGVVLHLDRTPAPHAHPPPLLRLQPPLRQRTQHRGLGHEGRLPPRVALLHQRAQERLVVRPAGEVAAAPQQQGLRQRLLEPAVALLAIAVLVAAGRIGRLGHQPVVAQQGPVVRREGLGLAVGMHRHGHAVRAVPCGHAAQVPQGVLQARAEAGEALREADLHVLPVRVRQHEVVQQMVERLAADGHAQARHVREVGGAQPARLMDLGEVDLLGGTVRRLPGAHAPLQGPPHRVRVHPRVGTLEPAQQRHRLQARLAGEHLLELRPYRGQRVQPGPPAPRPAGLTGELLQLPVLARALAVHA
jgi:hypothetical protein